MPLSFERLQIMNMISRIKDCQTIKKNENGSLILRDILINIVVHLILHCNNIDRNKRCYNTKIYTNSMSQYWEYKNTQNHNARTVLLLVLI